MAVKITKAWLDKLPFTTAGQRKFYDRDLKGFGVVVGLTKKTYFAEGYVRQKTDPDGKGYRSRRITIGPTTLFTLDQARTQAITLLAKMAQGIDPIDEAEAVATAAMEKKKHDQRQQLTLQALWDEFKKIRGPKLKPRTLDDYEKLMNRVFKQWLPERAGSITPDDVLALHAKVSNDSGPAYADGAFRVLRLVYNFGIPKKWVRENPVVGLKGEWNNPDARDSVIDADDLPKWFKAVDDLRSDKTNELARVGADYLELVIMTGLRRNEAATLKWSDVDFDKRTITITETKNGKPLVLPLPDHLVKLLTRRRQEVPDGVQWVFPSPGRKGKSKESKAKWKPLNEPRFAVELVTAKCGVKHTIHDLRRTFAVCAAGFLPALLLKKLINHGAKKTGDVTADHYLPVNNEQMRESLRDGMEKLASYFLTKKAAGQGMKIADATAVAEGA